MLWWGEGVSHREDEEEEGGRRGHFISSLQSGAAIQREEGKQELRR